MHLMLPDKLPCKLISCKSRAFECKTFFLGDGKSPNAFVHLELKTVKGRTAETLNRVGEELLSMMRQHFAQTAKNLELEISLEIVELETYFSPWTKQSKSSEVS